jgi:hypothetical protein
MNPPNEQDGDLVARVASGDEEAFRELHSRYNRNIAGFIGVRADNHEDAHDIAQDTWLTLWKKAAKYDSSRGAVSTFLRMIASTAIADFYRRNPPRADISLSGNEASGSGDGGSIEIGDLLERLKPSLVHCAPPGMNRLLEDLMLRLVFGGSSPPHQMIVFGFVERLGWTPREIVIDLSPRILYVLEEKLETDYAATSELSDSTIHAGFQILRNNMMRTLLEVLTEPKTKEICGNFLTSKTGETILNQYFTHSPAQEISHWCLAVRKRVASEILQRSRQIGTKIEPVCEYPGQRP